MNETANMLENALHGGEHRLGVRIYFEDTDAGGIVYHVVAVHDRMFVVRHAEIDYERPARLDDLITVATRVRQVSAATVMLDQTIRRGDETLVRIGLLLACVDRAGGRAVRLPADMRAALMRMHEAGVPGGETGDGQRAVEGD
ncbi:MAG: 4-hydroxybenzoyl-CoA thioesterase [Acidiphilium sp. 21-68-69]|nr:MAG: 4-hydroxybenzoyl-CoA thioesterase [Acidiphilium sp. 21-68-69]